MGDQTGALDDFSQALAINPDYVFALYDRGLLHADLGNTTAAIADLEATSQLCLELARTGCYDDAQYYLSLLQPESAAASLTNQSSSE
jgi:regulator of sirC expression with transglutaminase-like and TPR domain